MDAVEFIEEAKRMCNANISNCAECCKGRACPINLLGANYTPEERVKLVEKWAAAHPRKTRQDVFLEQWPEAKISDDGSINIMPCMLCFDEYNVDICTKEGRKCGECHRKFWSQAVE